MKLYEVPPKTKVKVLKAEAPPPGALFVPEGEVVLHSMFGRKRHMNYSWLIVLLCFFSFIVQASRAIKSGPDKGAWFSGLVCGITLTCGVLLGLALILGVR